jgi:hypothetical protein
MLLFLYDDDNQTMRKEEAKKTYKTFLSSNLQKSSLLYYPIRNNGGSVYLRNGGEE